MTWSCWFCLCTPKEKDRDGNEGKDENGKDGNERRELVQYQHTIPFVPPVQGGWVVKVYDGDTITIASRLPYAESPLYRFQVRLAGIDCPEMRGGTLHEKTLAIQSRDHLHGLIFQKWVTLKKGRTEKYGRLLADVYLGNLHINQWLLDNHLAVPYHGGKKVRPEEWDSEYSNISAI